MKKITMPCYTKEDALISKYLIEVDVEKLKKMRQEIIDRCSIIRHYEIDKYKKELENWKDNLLNNNSFEIRNYIEKNVANFNTFNEVIHVAYDAYCYPYLISIIDGILNQDISKMYELLEPNFDLEPFTIDEELKILAHKWSLDKQNKQLLNICRDLLKQKDYNLNQISVRDYYFKVMDLLTIQYISSKNFNSCEKHFEFANKNADYPNRQLMKFYSYKR